MKPSLKAPGTKRSKHIYMMKCFQTLLSISTCAATKRHAPPGTGGFESKHSTRPMLNRERERETEGETLPRVYGGTRPPPCPPCAER
jgi:hypothetical protein